MSEKKQFQIPAWLFIVLALVFDELVFQLWTGAQLTLPRLVTMLLFTGAFALLLALLSSFGSALVCRIVAIVLALAFAALYFAEYLMHDAYGGEGGYMSLGILFGTAAAAGDDFRDTIRSVVFKELWRLLLLLAPILAYAIAGGLLGWGKCKGWRTRAVLALAMLACYGLGVLTATHFPDAEQYDKQFEFVEAVNTFGLLTAFRLDLQNADRELDFALELPEPEAPTAETLPEAPPETEPEPETSETAPEETEPEETEAPVPSKPENALPIDFSALAETEPNAEIAKLHRYVASLTPSKTNEYTGLFAGKNLILITAESFSKEVIDPVLTPTLYRLATQGVQFTDYYQPAWGGSTSTGEYSLLTGLVPTSANAMSQSANKNLYFTMGNRLLAEGYASFGFHNNSYQYYHRDKTHPNLGYPDWMGMGNGMEEGVENTWPQSDREMVDFTMDLYLDKQPFSVYYMSVSGHGLYSQGGNYISKKNYDAVAELELSEMVKCYLAANLELEYAMADLLDRLAQEDLLDNTVIVLATDHYPYCLEKSSTWGTDRDYLHELYGCEVTDCFVRDHSALILWSGCLEGRDIVVDTPVYSLDVLPTLLNLFGVDYDSRLLVGRDVFSNAEPLVLWNTYSWKTDKGSYNAQTRRFTPNDGVTVDEAYVERISAVVSNKISFSRGVIARDYYNVLFPPAEE